MSDSIYQGAAIGLYFIGMLVIGWVASRRTANLDDYMLAGRNLSPGVAALSVGATDMSAWLLMGLPGAIYISGLGEAWIAIGGTLGAWLNWHLTARRLRAYSQVADNSITVPSFLENRFHTKNHALRLTAAVIMLVFFTFYVSAGLVAGGLLFQTVFGWEYIWGMLLVGIVTITYTVVGGFLGAAWTDVAQGLLMLGALVILPVIGIFALGGWGEFVSGVRDFDIVHDTGFDHLSLFSGTTVIGVISSLAWGLGHFGQPHLIVRYMAIRSPEDVPLSRRVHITWMIVACTGAIMVALVCLAYFPTILADPEAALLVLSEALVHPFIVGVFLSAILAAIMSSISSQLLVCSSALIADMYKLRNRQPNAAREVFLGRAGVVVVSVIAILLALDTDSLILELVSFAWAGFGATFGPVLLLSLFWRRFTAAGALAGMLTGAIVVVVWRYVDLGDAVIFELWEIVPGFIAAGLAAIAVTLTSKQDNPTVRAEFDEAVKLASGRKDDDNTHCDAEALVTEKTTQGDS